MSYFRARNLLLVMAFLVALVLAVTVVIRYQTETVIKLAAEALPEGVDLALKDIDYTHVEEGIARWRLQAEQVEHQSSAKLLMVRRPHLDFFDEQGEPQGTLVADEGRINSEYTQVQVTGSVVLESANGYTFYTDTLSYDQDRQLLSTDAPVKLLGEGFEMTGRGMRMNVASRQLKVLADVEATFEPHRFNQD